MTPNDRHVESVIDELESLIADLRSGVGDQRLTVFELRRRAAHATRDGFPPSSMGGDGGVNLTACPACGGQGQAGGADCRECDGEGTVRHPSYTDRTGDLAVSDPPNDPVRKAWADCRRMMMGALGDLRGAVNALARSLPPPTFNEGEVCNNHARYNIWEPLDHTSRNGNCRWCDDFNREQGQPAPKVLLEKRKQGQRIYPRDVDDALGRRKAG